MKIANVLISDSWGELTPDAFERGVGGREGAMMYLSREWAKLGHEVTNFVNVEKSVRFNETREVVGCNGLLYKRTIDSGYHEYVPLNLTNPVLGHFPFDAVIAWECPSIFKHEKIRENVKVKMCEMQVAHFGIEEMGNAEQYCDYVCALSEWHKQFLLSSGLNLDPENVLVFPNGVDIDRYRDLNAKEKIKKPIGDNPRFIYSSSPDRGLWGLLQSWPHIRKVFPKATLEVAYGVRNWTQQVKWMHGRQGEMAVELERLMLQPGVVDLGKIGQGELSKRQMEADAWLYPLDSIQATETGCITAVENAAAGNPIITTDADCMETEFGEIGVITELPFSPEGYAEAVEYVLTRPEIVADLRQAGLEFAETRDWGRIAPLWIEAIQNHN